MDKKFIFLFIISVILIGKSCKDEDEPITEPDDSGTYTPTPYTWTDPDGFPPMVFPLDNPLTVEGIELGRRLFYDERLSGDNSMSCSSCHSPAMNFTDTAQFSTGIHGTTGNRNSMQLYNLGYQSFFFWDGRVNTLEQQVLHPVMNPVEMDESWDDVIAKLEQDALYPEMFRKAFGTVGIDSVRSAKALAQFLRTMVSANSNYDKFLRGDYQFTTDELAGRDLFNKDHDELNGIAGGDCFHCHGEPMFTDNLFHNNGLDAFFTDLGRSVVTGNSFDDAKFKTPTLRNIALSFPYMHDGRFATLDEVLTHYSTGLLHSTTIDPLMKNVDDGGVNLTTQEKNQIIAFLNTLTDMDFINNPAFQDPGY
jgi:cytochrome c peroxidase